MSSSPAEQRKQYDDEISLVDLATIFVRRRRVFYVVFALIVLVGAIYAFLPAGEEKVKIVSLYRVADTGVEYVSPNGKNDQSVRVQRYIESPQRLITRFENKVWPAVREKLSSEGEAVRFSVTFDLPEATDKTRELGIIRLTTITSPENQSAVKKSHEQLMNSQASQVEEEKRSINAQIERVEQTLQRLQSQSAGSEAIAVAVIRQLDLQDEMNSINEGEVISLASVSSTQGTTNKPLILTLTLILAGMVGVFITFMAEFVASVRSAMNEELA